MIEDGQLDLAPMVREVILLELDLERVCRDDCAGLCPVCGVDRNTTPATATRPSPTSDGQRSKDSSPTTDRRRDAPAREAPATSLASEPTNRSPPPEFGEASTTSMDRTNSA